MQRILLLLISLIIIQQSFSQNNWHDLTGKQKAFFYQLTRKVENLNQQVFHLFEFTDSIPYVNDTLPDFPYIEKAIENDSSKLVCHHKEFARKSRGILADIATHYATWELDLVLQFKNSEKSKYQYLKPKAQNFERLILENVPSSSAKMWTDGTYTLSPKIASYYSPNLTIVEKIAALKNSSLNTNEKLTLLNAIYQAQNSYISNRSSEIIQLLTMQQIESKNDLIAAGNGSNWNDLESVIRTKYNRPLPDPKAFFAYNLVGKRMATSEKKNLSIQQNSVLKMATESNKKTNLHVDVWGYHPQRQTTLIVQKTGNSYVLFGNNDNRYLSPDSTFGEGTTYNRLIHELEFTWIADLKEQIYGKKGFDYLIDLYGKKIIKTRFKINKTEERLDKLRYTPEGPPKMKKNKKSRRQRKKGSSISYQDNQGTPRGKLSKTAKKKQIEQHNLVGYQGQFQSELATLKQLKMDKEEAFDLLAKYETNLDKLKKNFGYNLMSYTQNKNGFYTFSDGTTYNDNTQDLTFNPTGESDYFEVILVSFGKTVMDKDFEEVFVHLNLNYTNYTDVFTLKQEQNVANSSYLASDSIQIQEFFKAIQLKKLKHEISANITSNQQSSDTVFSYSIINQINIANTLKINLTGTHNQFKPKNVSTALAKLSSNTPTISTSKIATAMAMNSYFIAWKKELIQLAQNWIPNQKQVKKITKELKKLKMPTTFADGSVIKI